MRARNEVLRPTALQRRAAKPGVGVGLPRVRGATSGIELDATASIPPLRLDEKPKRIALKSLVDGEHDMAVEFLDAQLATAHKVAELVVMVDIAAKHPHQIIDPAADFVAFQDFVAFADGRQKTLEIGFAVVFEDNLDQQHHRAADFREIEVGDIAPYQPILFERPDPL
jgi:hypothetical protein